MSWNFSLFSCELCVCQTVYRLAGRWRLIQSVVCNGICTMYTQLECVKHTHTHSLADVKNNKLLENKFWTFSCQNWSRVERLSSIACNDAIRMHIRIVHKPNRPICYYTTTYNNNLSIRLVQCCCHPAHWQLHSYYGFCFSFCTIWPFCTFCWTSEIDLWRSIRIFVGMFGNSKTILSTAQLTTTRNHNCVPHVLAKYWFRSASDASIHRRTASTLHTDRRTAEHKNHGF